MLPGIFIGYALNSEGGWTGDLTDWHDIENTNKCKKYVHFLAQVVSLRQDSRARRRTLRRRRVESTRGDAPSTLGEARVDLFCKAQGITLCKKKTEF